MTSMPQSWLKAQLMQAMSIAHLYFGPNSSLKVTLALGDITNVPFELIIGSS